MAKTARAAKVSLADVVAALKKRPKGVRGRVTFAEAKKARKLRQARERRLAKKSTAAKGKGRGKGKGSKGGER